MKLRLNRRFGLIKKEVDEQRQEHIHDDHLADDEPKEVVDNWNRAHLQVCLIERDVPLLIHEDQSGADQRVSEIVERGSKPVRQDNQSVRKKLFPYQAAKNDQNQNEVDIDQQLFNRKNQAFNNFLHGFKVGSYVDNSEYSSDLQYFDHLSRGRFIQDVDPLGDFV